MLPLMVTDESRTFPTRVAPYSENFALMLPIATTFYSCIVAFPVAPPIAAATLVSAELLTVTDARISIELSET